jgi:hypothetical protein
MAKQELIMTKFAMLFLTVGFGPAMAFASPSDVHDCVQRSKADGSNVMAIAKQCSGVQSSQNVGLVRQCVDEVRHQDGFNMPDTATACAGVKDVKQLRDCLKQERADGFNDEELVVVCNQK